MTQLDSSNSVIVSWEKNYFSPKNSIQAQRQVEGTFHCLEKGYIHIYNNKKNMYIFIKQK